MARVRLRIENRPTRPADCEGGRPLASPSTVRSRDVTVVAQQATAFDAAACARIDNDGFEDRLATFETDLGDKTHVRS